MNGNVVARPQFSEGQVLSASALDLGVDYARESLERHSLDAHTAGVVHGLQIVFHPQAMPGTGNDAYVAAGMAVDSSGRQINVLADTLLAAGVLGSEPGWYPAYVWTSDEVGSLPRAIDPCATSVSDQIIERPYAAFILDPTLTGAGSQYVCIGQAYWDPVAKGLGDNGAAPSLLIGRQLAGVRVGAIIAAEGSISVQGDSNDPNAQVPAKVRVKGDLRVMPVTDSVRQSVGGALGTDGGAIELRDPSTEDAKTVRVMRTTNAQGGNVFEVRVGASDPKNIFAVADNDGNIGASIDATGSLHASGTTVDTILTIGTSEPLTLGPTNAPRNAIGIAAGGDLALQFGKNAKAVLYDDLGNAVAEFDPGLFKVFADGGELRTGKLPGSGNFGLETSTGSVDLRAGSGDINLLTSGNLNINESPLWQSIGGVPMLRLGPFGACFGRETWSGTANDAGSTLVIHFPVTFASSPQVFVSPIVAGDKLFVALESLDTRQATISVVRFTPGSPSSGDNATRNNDAASVDVCWLAVGSL